MSSCANWVSFITQPKNCKIVKNDFAGAFLQFHDSIYKQLHICHVGFEICHYDTYIANTAFLDVRNVLSNLDCFGVQHANFAACKTAFDGAQNAAESLFIA